MGNTCTWLWLCLYESKCMGLTHNWKVCSSLLCWGKTGGVSVGVEVVSETKQATKKEMALLLFLRMERAGCFQCEAISLKWF